MNLYKVNLQGLKHSSTGASLSPAYVVAEDPTSAYLKVRLWADEREYGFRGEREMESVELVAQSFDPKGLPGEVPPLFLTEAQ